jgi:ribosomal protein S18 acetylase RimI-like enzyme
VSKEIQIRQATAADLELVAPLFNEYRQFYGQPADLALARRFLAERFAQGDSVIFLAVGPSSAEGLGFTQLYPSFSSVTARRIWILNDLYVVPVARRAGVGRQLMEAARQYGVSTGARRLVLSTAHTNVSAQRLYEAVGYVREPHFRQYELDLEG